jgi:ferredoxin
VVNEEGSKTMKVFVDQDKCEEQENVREAARVCPAMAIWVEDE